MRGRWMLAGSLALALVAPPSMAGAAPPRPKPTPNVAPQPDPELLARARTLSVEGSKRFDTRDYGGAIVAWSEAYALLPDEPIYQSYRLHFLIQIAFSHKENYRYTGDVFYLEFAKTEFERYHASLPADDLGGRSLIDEELVWIVDQMKKFEGAEAARAQDAYEIYLQTYLRSHAAGPYPNSFARGRSEEPVAILSGREVFEQMQMPAQGRRFARHRRLSLAGWGLAVVGAFVAMPATSFAIASAVLDREADLVAGAFIGVGGLVLAAGLGMGLGGTDVLDKIDIYGAIMNHNRQRQLELGLIGSLPSLDLPARTTAAQRRKARGNPPPWRWPAIGGMTGGAILTITGGVLVGLHKTCPDGSDPRMYFNACPQVYDTAAAGGVLLGVGLSATVGMTALLTVGEIRHRRRATFEQRRARFEKLTGFRMAPVVQGVVLSL